MDYLPAPIDTSRIQLPADLLALTEQLAANTHDLWAARRIANGWRHGPVRDDRRKLHPSLVPYDRLPEPEREYDRATALGTVKAILSLGYRLVPPGDAADSA